MREDSAPSRECHLPDGVHLEVGGEVCHGEAGYLRTGWQQTILHQYKEGEGDSHNADCQLPLTVLCSAWRFARDTSPIQDWGALNKNQSSQGVTQHSLMMRSLGLVKHATQIAQVGAQQLQHTGSTQVRHQVARRWTQLNGVRNR